MAQEGVKHCIGENCWYLSDEGFYFLHPKKRFGQTNTHHCSIPREPNQTIVVNWAHLFLATQRQIKLFVRGRELTQHDHCE